MAGSTLASRTFGRELQKYRERAGLAQYAVARAVETSPQTYGRLEDGVKRNVTSLMLNAICDKLRVSDAERRQLLTLAEEVRAERKSEGGWWRAYFGNKWEGFEYFLHLEEAARRLTQRHSNLIPGLLHAYEYRQQLIWAEYPNWSPEQIAGRMAIAEERQRRLREQRFEYEAFIPESVLRQLTGGPRVMHDQLHHLVHLSDLPNVTIRAIPAGATDPMAGLMGTFLCLDFPPLPNTGLTPTSVVFLEQFAGALYLETEDEVVKYKDASERLRRLTLGTSETRDLILAIARERSS
ncbi:helix-turn-helix domain-containing protein [Nocardia sp. NPDC051570]|uniref:helix-turn-helix domain-containing protein n=1 Tax=Nocardia sp. NPDC051570 TaxID=3364324 RepID=UPI0037B5717E